MRLGLDFELQFRLQLELQFQLETMCAAAAATAAARNVIVLAGNGGNLQKKYGNMQIILEHQTKGKRNATVLHVVSVRNEKRQ